MNEQTVYDVLGVGFGPANLALAIAMEERYPQLSIRFLEARSGPSWQPGMLLEGSDIQNHPVRDLVSLRNPRSRYSFINYLYEQGRLLEHLNLPLEFPLRKEYAQYVCWTAEHFAHLVDYGRRVTEIRLESHPDPGIGACYRLTSTSGESYLGRSLAFAPGRSPYLPDPFATIRSERVFHLVDYLPAVSRLAADREPGAIAVVGGSQSAVELTLDLARRFRRSKVVTLARPYALRLKDTSPFSEEGFFPDFTDYYYAASRAGKQKLDSYLHYTNYSSADRDVLDELYVLIYEQRIDGEQRVFVHGNRVTTEVADHGDRVKLTTMDIHTGLPETEQFDFVVLATGFRNLGPSPHQESYPPLLAGVIDHFRFEPDGHLAVTRDYRLAPRDPGSGVPPLFLNGLCESSHGIGDAGSFSLLSLRAETLAESLAAHIPASHDVSVSEEALL